jgi:hypothetical protein
MTPMRVRRWLLDQFDRSRRLARAGSRRQRLFALTAESLETRELLAVLVTPHSTPVSVLKHVQVVSIFYGNYWNPNPPNPAITNLETQLDTYLDLLSGSQYLGDLAEYGVGTGSLINSGAGLALQHDVVDFPMKPLAFPDGTPVVYDRNALGVVDPNNIQDMIRNQIAPAAGAPTLPAPVAGTTLYFVWVQPGVVVGAQDFTGANQILFNTTSFGGYHFFTNAKDGTQFAYAVMPFPTGAAQANAGLNYFQFLTAVGSHELGEATSDPYATGWFYRNTGGEIGDLCNGQWMNYTVTDPATGLNQTYVVQALWSNLIALSTYPHALPLMGGNSGLPGVVNSPAAIGSPRFKSFTPSPPSSTPPPRPTQPAPPTLGNPASPTPPTHPGPSIPGGASLVQPAIVVSTYNPNDLAVASQNGLEISTSGGAAWSSLIPFPTASSGDSSVVYDKKGNLFWSYLNPTTGGITITERDPSTGALIAGPYVADAPASGSTDVQQTLVADNPDGSARSNNLYLAWSQLSSSGSSQILVSLSTNQGKTWLPPVTVASSMTSFIYGTAVTVGPDGLIYVAYHALPGFSLAPDKGIVPDGASGQTLLAIFHFNTTTSSLTQQGSTITVFSAGKSDITFNDQSGSRKIAGTRFSTQGSVIPNVLVDPSQPGVAYVVTVQDPNAGTTNPPSSEVVIATLIQNASTGAWSTTTQSVATPSSSSTFQLFPTAAIDQNGDVVVSWYSNQNNKINASGDDLLDVFAAYSVQGGPFGPAFQVSTQSFDPDAGAASVLPGPPPTTGIGNSFGIALAGSTVFVAHNANTFSGPTATGQQVGVDSFALPGTLVITPSTGNITITIRRTSSTSDIDVVLLNNVPVFTGSLASLSGGIVINHGQDVDNEPNGDVPIPSLGNNDTLVLDYTNGDPVPAAGVTFDAAEGGSNVIQVNADASYRLSDSSLTIVGTHATDTVSLDDVVKVQLTGGPSNDNFTLSGWSGSTTITGGTGTNTLTVAAGTVATASLALTNVQSLSVTGGALDVNGPFTIPSVLVQNAGTLQIDNGVSLFSNVTNSGILTLGGLNLASATISGSYTQTSSGTLDIKLAGTSSGQYDRLTVTGNASLGGTLNVSLVGGFSPASGNSFQVLTVLGTLTNDFGTKNFPALGGGLIFVTSKNSGIYTLTVTT